MSALEKNCREFGIPLYDINSANQGIVHVIGPELGLTQPGMTIACGDSHTSTHGAFGAIAFGIGTSQVRDVLASQCLAMEPLKVRRITVNGALRPGVYAKDVILDIIRRLGVKGGAGYAYEYGGDTFDRMTMEERMTVCNMSIEGAARVGYVNPDETTFEYIEGRPFAPQGRGLRQGAAVVGVARLRRRCGVRRRRRDGCGGDRADRDVGHQPGAVGRHQREAAVPVRRPRRRQGVGRRSPRVHELPRRHADRRARRSTSPSSAPARTAASPICARPRGWSRASTSRST